MAVALVAGLFGLSAGFGGALIGSHATIVTQSEGARENRKAEARQQRARAYTAFLSAAASYERLTSEVFDDPPRCVPSAKNSVKCAFKGTTIELRRVRERERAAQRMHDQQNQTLVYLLRGAVGKAPRRDDPGRDPRTKDRFERGFLRQGVSRIHVADVPRAERHATDQLLDEHRDLVAYCVPG